MQRALFGQRIFDSISESCLCAAFSLLPILIAIVFNLPDAMSLTSDGNRSPLADYSLGGGFAILIHFVIGLAFRKDSNRFLLNLLWSAKVWVILFFALFYEAKYPSLDAFEYFLSGALDNQTFQKRLLYGDGTNNMKLFIFVLNAKIIGPSYHLSKVLCAFAGFIGLVGYFKGVCAETKRDDWCLLLALMITPSILFWTSILGKDPFITLFLGWHFYFLQKFLHGDRMKFQALLASFIALALSGYVRVWIPAIFGVSMIFGLAVVKRKSLGGALLLAASACGVIMGARYFSLTNVDEVVAYFDRASKLWARGGSGQLAPPFHDLYDLLAFVPTGALTALFRPLPGEIAGVLGLLSGLENLILLLSFSLCLILVFVFGLYSANRAFIFSSVVFWSLIYGFVSYQNLGTGVRFRNQIAPLLVIWSYLVLRGFVKKLNRLDTNSTFTVPMSENLAAKSSNLY